MPGRKRYRTETGPRPSRVGRLKRAQTRGKASGRKARNALVKVPRGKLAFPQEMRATLRYVDTFNLTPSSQSATGFSIRGNDLYDPQVSVGGHQPRGFDQYTVLYKKFTVVASKISVTFAYEAYNGCTEQDVTGMPLQSIQSQNDAVVGVPSCICLIHKAVAPNTSQTIEQFQEQDRTKWKTITSQSDAKTVSTGLKASEFFGKDFLVGADGYTGTASSHPENQLYYHIMAARNSDEYPGSVKLRANVVVEYDAVWTEPKQLPAS